MVEARVDIARMEEVVAVGDRDEVRGTRQCQRPPRGLREQRLAVGQRHEGLRCGFARQRPQARARATGKNDREERSVHHGEGMSEKAIILPCEDV